MASARKRKSFVLPPQTPSTSFVHLNDDARETEERRNLRREKSNDTPSVARPESTISIGRAKLAKMTATEKIEHTEKCIQLSAANKISAKNAFSLLLIDQMVDLVRKEEEANFQVASTHLDASAKIYAARVDKVHADVLRFAGGLTSNKPRAAVQDADDDDEDAGGEDGAVGEDAGAAPVKAKKKRRARTVIQKDKKALKSAAHLRSVNIGDLYLQTLVTSQEASEPGNCHFLLTLPTSGDRYKLQLRGDDLAFPPVCAEIPSEANVRMPDFHACLALPLLPAEIHHMLVEGDADRTQSQIAPFDLPAAAAAAEQDRDRDRDDLPAPDFGDDDFADDDGPDDEGGGGGDTMWLTEEVGAGGRRGGDGDGPANVVALADTLCAGARLLTPQDYMHLHRAALGLSTGPRDWRPPRPRPSTVIRPVAQRRGRIRAPTEVEFDAGAAAFAAFEASSHTELSEATVSGWRHSTHLLPAADPDRGKRFYSFWMRKRATPRGLNGEEPRDPAADDLADGPQVVDLDASYTNFVCGAEDDEDDDHDMADIDDAEALNAAAANGAHAAAAELAPLNYAKRAKGIDMRMLKRCTWDIIRHNLGDKENALPSQETTLTEVYNRLPAKLSSKMATNLSPALAYMSVLHLANEHNLALENPPDLTELFIRKG